MLSLEPPPSPATPGRLGPPGAAGLGRVQPDEPEPDQCLGAPGGPAMSQGCLSVIKYFLFLFNLLFFVLGGIILSFGLWILIDQQSFSAVLVILPVPLPGSSLYALKVWSYVLSGVGIVTMLLGFILGCLGALKEIKCMLGFYFGFLFLLFAAQITIGVLLYTQRVTLSGKAGVFVTDVIWTYPLAGPPSEKYQSWDFIQGQVRPPGPSPPAGTHPEFCPAPGCEAWLVRQAPVSLGSPFSQADPCIRSTGKKWDPSSNSLSLSPQLCLMMLSMFLFRNMGQNYDKLTRYS
ncbi:LOW QUALITY PROTEIN: leukocyte antigen CD37 [Macrochelys suwanniensis]